MRCSIIYLICVVFLIACNDVTVGYLETENAEYIPDNMEIPQIEDLDEVVDALRVKNNAPWVTQPIQGIEGTDPMIYSIEERIVVGRNNRCASFNRKKNCRRIGKI